MEKNPKRDGKIGFKTSQNSCVKLAKTTLVYKATKTSRWGKSPSQMTCRSTGRCRLSKNH